MEEPAEISVADVLTMRSDVPGVAYVTLGSGGTRGLSVGRRRRGGGAGGCQRPRPVGDAR